jgi:uncharacterized protein YgbK (DUF1537 family)
MKTTGARHIHYKVCSTFDSSPVIGSIGKAIDCGASVFKNKVIPVLGGMPSLGRYCLFGNLYARMGIGSQGKIYRLDRHPSMSTHPVTPSDESDLRIHLGKQTGKKIGLIDLANLETPVERWNRLEGNSNEAVLIDALYESQLEKIGEWMDTQFEGDLPLFSVGSSGIEKALGDFWNRQGILHSTGDWKQAGNGAPLLVVSGSCSPVTKEQIDYAISVGFAEVSLSKDSFNGNNWGGYFFGCDYSAIVEAIKDGRNVIVHSNNISGITGYLPAESVGKALGMITKEVCKQVSIKRIVVAGGDTSSYAAREMGIQAVEMIAPMVPGAPLCRAYAPGSPVHNIEINFKGGQVGAADYFEMLLNGTVVKPVKL